MPAETHPAEPQLNATPLIDVLLVLIVMLIFTLPVMSHLTKLTLPIAAPDAPLREVFHLQIDYDGVMSLNEERFESVAALETRLRGLAGMVPAPAVRFSADARCPYEPVAQVLAATQRAHVRNLSIVNIANL